MARRIAGPPKEPSRPRNACIGRRAFGQARPAACRGEARTGSPRRAKSVRPAEDAGRRGALPRATSPRHGVRRTWAPRWCKGRSARGRRHSGYPSVANSAWIREAATLGKKSRRSIQEPLRGPHAARQRVRQTCPAGTHAPRHGRERDRGFREGSFAGCGAALPSAPPSGAVRSFSAPTHIRNGKRAVCRVEVAHVGTSRSSPIVRPSHAARSPGVATFGRAQAASAPWRGAILAVRSR